MTTIYSPTRVDLAGGTLDLWPIYLFVGDCVTVNLSIDVFTGVEMRELEGQSFEIEVSDLSYKKTFSNLDELMRNHDAEMKLVQAVLGHFKPQKGFYLKTFSQSPVGGGLGGSSSLCISLMKALCLRANMQLSPYEMANVAHNIEAKILKTPTGTQDYFPAIVPGLNLIHYTENGPTLESVEFPRDLFAERMLLVYTGKAHHSGINNWQVYKSVIDGDTRPLATLKRLAEISDKVAKICRTKEWDMLPQLFQEEYKARTELSSGFSSPEIEKLQTLVLRNGGDAVKICGAGGGGCVLVWADPAKHEAIKSACQKNGFRPMVIKPVDSKSSALPTVSPQPVKTGGPRKSG